MVTKKRKKKSDLVANLNPVSNLWYPSLSMVSQNLDLHSWSINNKLIGGEAIFNDYIYEQKEIFKSYKIRVFPNNEQNDILNKWFNNCISIYNQTNKLIKDNIYVNDVLDFKKALQFIKWKKIRDEYIKPAKKILMDGTNVPSHSLDYAIKQICEMYSSALTNLKDKNIKEFNIKDSDINRRRKNIVIEPQAFSKKKLGFFISQLGEMRFDDIKKYPKLNNIDLHNIKNNCILQYDTLLDQYNLIIPVESTSYKDGYKVEKCGIDPGVRTFLTTYYNNRVLEFGTNIEPKLLTYMKRIDNINKNIDNKLLSKTKAEKAKNKRYNRITNLVNDLHFKTANFLVENFDTIRLGKINTKSIVSNDTGNLHEKSKRLLYSLSHYRFRERLKNKCEATGSKLLIVNEYKTTKTCSRCSKEYEIGGSKVYKCSGCKLEIDRDINSAINMYK